MNSAFVERAFRICAGVTLAITMMSGVAGAQSVRRVNAFPGANDPRWLQAPYKGNDPYVHNGSGVEMEDRGEFIHITYMEPRSSLAALGVVKGTLLFSGRHEGDSVYGVAYTFKANCPPAAYAVQGQFDSQSNLVLVGNAPKRGFGCDIVGYSEFSASNRLVFIEAFGDE